MRNPTIRLDGRMVSAGLICTLAVGTISPAQADEPLGAYVGAAVGRGIVKADLPVLPLISVADFNESRTAFSAVLGIRPMRYLGAEIGYVDFGRNSESFDYDAMSTNISLKADTAFAVLYLPVSAVDFYGKVGAARLQSSVSAIANYVVFTSGALAPACFTQPCSVSAIKLTQYTSDQTSTNFAFGAGLQVKAASWGRLGSLAVRFEYERFNFAGENPFFASLGVNWTFF
jgi:Outer membrane protein beta-barrel domain